MTSQNDTVLSVDQYREGSTRIFCKRKCVHSDDKYSHPCLPLSTAKRSDESSIRQQEGRPSLAIFMAAHINCVPRYGNWAILTYTIDLRLGGCIPFSELLLHDQEGSTEALAPRSASCGSRHNTGIEKNIVQIGDVADGRR